MLRGILSGIVLRITPEIPSPISSRILLEQGRELFQFIYIFSAGSSSSSYIFFSYSTEEWCRNPRDCIRDFFRILSGFLVDIFRELLSESPSGISSLVLPWFSWVIPPKELFRRFFQLIKEYLQWFLLRFYHWLKNFFRSRGYLLNLFRNVFRNTFRNLSRHFFTIPYDYLMNYW